MYDDDDQQERRRRRFIKIGAAGGVVFVFALIFAIGAALERVGPERLRSIVAGRSETPEALHREILETPEVAGTFGSLRRHYPDDYQALLTSVSDLRRAGQMAEARQEMAEFLHRFMLSKLNSITSAPHADLQQIAAGYAEFTRALRDQDVRLCATFAMAGFRPGQQIPRALIPHLDRVNAIQIRAAHRAETGPRIARGEASQEHIDSWFEQLRRNDPSTAALLQSGRVDSATPAQQCAGGIAIYQAAAELDPEASASMTANLLRESARAVN